MIENEVLKVRRGFLNFLNFLNSIESIPSACKDAAALQVYISDIVHSGPLPR